jgi:transposase InsO family protein
MGVKVTHLAREYKVSRETIYETLEDGRKQIFENRSSMNHRYRTILYGFKKLARTEKRVGERLARKAHRLNRYEKAIPGEMLHLDTKRLPLLRGEAAVQPREYLFVAVDDHSRSLFADIFPDKTSYSAAMFVREARNVLPFPVTGIYSDNGSEYKGRGDHPVVALARETGMSQGFTKVKHPWTNGKAERVIRTLMEEWHGKTRSNHISRAHRRRYLYAYVDWYNQNRVHQSLGMTPFDKLELYLKSVNNALT